MGKKLTFLSAPGEEQTGSLLST